MVVEGWGGELWEGGARREGARGPTCFFGPTFQSPRPDSGLEGSRLWSVEMKESRMSGLALGGMKGAVAVLFLKNGFQQGSL